MEKLLTYIYNQLKSTGYKVFDKQVPSTSEYPYITYRISEPTRNVNPQLYDLTIDTWDNSNSTYTIETLTSEIDFMLENLSYVDEEISIKIKRQARNSLDDPDPTIKRRQLVYELRVIHY